MVKFEAITLGVRSVTSSVWWRHRVTVEEPLMGKHAASNSEGVDFARGLFVALALSAVFYGLAILLSLIR